MTHFVVMVLDGMSGMEEISLRIALEEAEEDFGK